MKTGDETFDDIYISKDTGKVVGVMYEGNDYKLVPSNGKTPARVTYDGANAFCKALVAGESDEIKEYAGLIVNYIYGK